MMTVGNIRGCLAGVAAAALLCASAYGQGADEQAQLQRREREARARIERLREEQRLLLFQKTLAAADSKYLVLDVAAGKGTLRYRNRVLNSFKFTARKKGARPAVAAGAVSLSTKIEGSSLKRRLVFGDSQMIIHAKGARVEAGTGGNTLHVPLNRKDFASLFNVLEQGSLAYVY